MVVRFPIGSLNYFRAFAPNASLLWPVDTAAE